MSEIAIYKSTDNKVEVAVQMDNETVCNKHIKNIYKEGELSQEATISKMEIVREEGKRQIVRKIEHYNLDMVFVGYRVNSSRATQFRIWATQRIKDFFVNFKIAA